LRLVRRQYIEHYNRERPHLALDLRPPEATRRLGDRAVERQPRLGGLINEYYRAACRREPTAARHLLPIGRPVHLRDGLSAHLTII
jgi:hypothetical protein